MKKKMDVINVFIFYIFVLEIDHNIGYTIIMKIDSFTVK